LTEELNDLRDVGELPPSRPRLRIAVVGTRGVPSNYSGVERACETLYAAMAARGHEVTVYSRAAAVSESPEIYRGIRLTPLPSLKGRYLETLSHSGLAVMHALAKQRTDLIHIHALAPNLFAPFCRLAGMTTVTTVHGLDWQRAKWKGLGAKVLELAERSMVSYVDEIICVSRNLQDHYVNNYHRNVTYIPNGMEQKTANKIDLGILNCFSLCPDKYIVFVGRLVPEKRVEDLLRAFASVDVPHRLAIVGEGQHSRDYVRRLHALAQGDDRVVFTGPQAGAALDTLSSQAALYVSASDLEGSPMALLEALALGVPPVLSDISAHREIMGAVKGYDLFFAPRDVAELADRLKHAVHQTDTYRELVRQHREEILHAYDWHKIVPSTEGVYYRALQKRGKRSARLDGGALGREGHVIALANDPPDASPGPRRRTKRCP
jgi:glycosyltransferase involved in cell wall biosynthesis